MKKNYALKSIFISFAGLLIFAFTSCQSSNVSVSRSGAGISEKIKVDIKNVSPINEGVFEGWGTSLCWWGNRLGGNEKLSNEAVDLFFTMDKGIGLNIIRYNIGGGDDPSITILAVAILQCRVSGKMLMIPGILIMTGRQMNGSGMC